jgi:hypothetical protein
MTHKVIWWRPFTFLLGVAAAGIGCYGAWEYALKLERSVSYLVVAAPVVAGAAALCPVIAHWSWADKQRIKAILWWLLPLPLAAAVVFFSAAERVHVAKAGEEAVRSSLSRAAERSRKNLEEAQAAFKAADQAEAKFRGAKQCGPQCRAARETLTIAKQRLEEAADALTKAEASAPTESPLKAPVWLLPAALDMVAFFAIWSGLGGPWRVSVEERPTKKKRRKKKPKRTPPAKAGLRVVAGNSGAA